MSDFNDNDNGTTLSSEVAVMEDYYFMYKDGTQDGVMAQVRALSGQATMFPLWAMGHFQSRERYKSSDEVCNVLDKYRALKIPIDCMGSGLAILGLRLQLECHAVHESALYQQDGRQELVSLSAL